MSDKKLTKKDLWKFHLRYLISSGACQNYESMQSCSVVYSMGPFLEKIYGDNPEVLKEKFRIHFQFFNCQHYFGGAINAAALAIEETKTENASEIAAALKTSMMGPFAGIGDALFNTLPKVIFSALSAYAAIEGSFLTGAILMFICTPILFLVRWEMVKIGYYQGLKFIGEKQDQLNNLRTAISIMGIIVVGAMIATNVKITTPLTIDVGESSMIIQETLDKILPNLLPASAVLAVYFGFNIKKMNTIRMVWLIIIVSVLLSVAGIIA